MYIEWLITIIIITIPILILMLFVYSVIKKNKFYLGYAIIELIWFIIFFFINGISLISELNPLKLDVIYIFLAYIVISCLYLPLFKKNESKKVDE